MNLWEIIQALFIKKYYDEKQGGNKK